MENKNPLKNASKLDIEVTECYNVLMAKKETKMTLNERINTDIDRLITKLEDAKKEKASYLKKARLMGEVAKNAEGCAFYWEEKLNDLLMGAA